MNTYLPLVLLPFALLLATAAAGENTAAAWRVYIGTYARGEEKGIYFLEFNAETGALASKGRVCGAESPSFLDTHPSLPILYAVCERGHPEGAVEAFRIEPDSGGLTPLSRQSSKGAAPCHLAVAPGAKHLAVANYSSGSTALFPLLEDGALGAASVVIQHRGSSVHPRQKGPHAHCVNFDASGERLYAADLGIDQVLIYRYDRAPGTLTANEPAFAALAPGAGPRHMAFHPSGQFVYVVNEINSTVTAFRKDPATGGLAPFGSVSTLPADFDGESTTAEIAVHPSGRFLYASNRGHDSIAVFAIDSDNGKLTALGQTPTGGKTPRNFSIDPSGQYLLAANQDSDNVVVFRIDAEQGLLEPTGQSVSVPAPVCVLFYPAP